MAFLNPFSQRRRLPGGPLLPELAVSFRDGKRRLWFALLGVLVRLPLPDRLLLWLEERDLHARLTGGEEDFDPNQLRELLR